MALTATHHETKYLRALVDMGSNGIRFSISSLQPPTERVMPTLYQDRASISLYDAQYSPTGERVPIDDETTLAVLQAFSRFKTTCHDFGVPESNITVLATEATRTAINSEEFRKRIKHAVGWEVKMLPKEEEGRVGAFGVASSLPQVKGLVMDLGGGSTQLSWLIKENGHAEVRMPDSGAVSMPFGAAAMSRRLSEATKAGKVVELKAEISSAIKDAYTKINVPEEIYKQPGGITLYLSGGGFRGWGYVLMSQHPVDPYPVQVINGFRVDREAFLSTDKVKDAAAASLDDSSSEADIFRVSDRRASQVPAVAFLITVLAETLPSLKEVRFCQGGVREGHLFSSLSPKLQAQDPLVVATQPFAGNGADSLAKLLHSALPSSSEKKHSHDPGLEAVFSPELLQAFSNSLYHHAGYGKDLQTPAALRSTTSGIFAGAHGVTHESRALLALLLAARWAGPIPPNDEKFKLQLERLVGDPETVWWVKYLGAVAGVVAGVYPAGYVKGEERVGFKAHWDDKGEEGKRLLVLKAAVGKGVDKDGFKEGVKEIVKVGKRKNWVGGKEGVGYKVDVVVSKA